jgi:putative tricarboxylic transport membrane protein
MSDGAEPRSRRGPTIRNPQDFWGCLTLIGLALFALWAGYDLPGKEGFSLGPGTAPRLFAGCLLLLAGVVAIRALLVEGAVVGRFHLRGPLVVLISVLAFAAMIRPLGLPVTTFVSFMIASAASSDTRWGEATITAVVFTIGAVLLFFYGLALQFPLWPAFLL